MDKTFSIQETKSRISEVLAYALDGYTVTIVEDGEPLAEIRRVKPLPKTNEERLEELRRRGAIVPAKDDKAPFTQLAVRPGALQRFLEDRHRWP